MLNKNTLCYDCYYKTDVYCEIFDKTKVGLVGQTNTYLQSIECKLYDKVIWTAHKKKKIDKCKGYKPESVYNTG